ncbi:hypothetical protein [uncultured Sphingomonas sp.]|uniref:hypothetical protein n=1 Tax=uncultured Sphingomonas sp. TaxID=158754 RepID=UPI00374A3095
MSAPFTDPANANAATSSGLGAAFEALLHVLHKTGKITDEGIREIRGVHDAAIDAAPVSDEHKSRIKAAYRWPV